LNDLLSKNRRLEMQFQKLLDGKQHAVQCVLDGLTRGTEVRLDRAEAALVANAMVVVLTYWLSYEYVRDPRHALEPETAGAAMMRGAYHVLSLLMPYLDAGARQHLHALAGTYQRK